MENQTSTVAPDTAAPEGSEVAASGFGDRIRERAHVVKSQIDAAEAKARQRWADSKVRQRLAGSAAAKSWQEVPVKLRTALQQAVGKVRTGLDLPSRRELSDLSQRMDELDKKLGEYEVAASARKKRKNEQGDWA